MTLAAETAAPVGQKISPGGVVFSDAQTLVDDVGLAWRASLQSPTPIWLFTAVPSCADIAGDFADCSSLAGAVSSCTALLSWGFS